VATSAALIFLSQNFSHDRRKGECTKKKMHATVSDDGSSSSSETAKIIVWPLYCYTGVVGAVMVVIAVQLVRLFRWDKEDPQHSFFARKLFHFLMLLSLLARVGWGVVLAASGGDLDCAAKHVHRTLGAVCGVFFFFAYGSVVLFWADLSMLVRYGREGMLFRRFRVPLIIASVLFVGGVTATVIIGITGINVGLALEIGANVFAIVFLFLTFGIGVFGYRVIRSVKDLQRRMPGEIDQSGIRRVSVVASVTCGLMFFVALWNFWNQYTLRHVPARWTWVVVVPVMLVLEEFSAIMLLWMMWPISFAHRQHRHNETKPLLYCASDDKMSSSIQH
jgi:hypothetical protein